ncbi:hypothetical protein ACSTK4_23420, partial [Vibrio parahaemolyticus]
PLKAHYGAAASLSLDVNTPASTSNQGNNYSGGNSLSPYVGFSWNAFGKSFVGSKISYTYESARTIDPNRAVLGSKQKTGGNQTQATVFF